MPEGIGHDLRMVRKSLSISGSLTVDLWDEKLLTGIIELGLPVVFLPHTATEPLTNPNTAAMRILPDLWRTAPGGRVRTSLPLPPIDWFEAHSKDVRRRLHLLPGAGTYEFAILQMLRQLCGVCDRTSRHAGNNTDATPEHISALFWDLHSRAFRGITLGVAACLGFDPGCPREKALRILNQRGNRPLEHDFRET
jgi:hypothetical protein